MYDDWKWLATFVLLLVTGCTLAPRDPFLPHNWACQGDTCLTTRCAHQEVVNSPALQDNSFTPVVVSGHSFAIDSSRVVTVLGAAREADQLFTFLRSHGISPRSDEVGNTVLRDSLALRSSLTEYVDLIEQRADVIASNMANVNTAGDGDDGSLPYRRRILTIHENGETSIDVDPSAFRLLWSPNSPLAIKDGEKKGFVRYPNVDLGGERVDLELARREYEFACDVLRKLYHDCRCPCLAGEAQGEVRQ